MMTSKDAINIINREIKASLDERMEALDMACKALEKSNEYTSILDALASRIASRSDYHGDSILVAIELLKEGKSPKDIYIPTLNDSEIRWVDKVSLDSDGNIRDFNGKKIGTGRIIPDGRGGWMYEGTNTEVQYTDGTSITHTCYTLSRNSNRCDVCGAPLPTRNLEEN